MKSRDVELDNQLIDEQLSMVPVEQWTRLFGLCELAFITPYGRWAGGEVSISSSGQESIQVPYFVFSDQFNEFIKYLYEIGLIVPINWSSSDRLESKEIESADNVALVRMLISIVRGDRFIEGLLAEYAENGILTQIFTALKHQYQSP